MGCPERTYWTYGRAAGPAGKQAGGAAAHRSGRKSNNAVNDDWELTSRRQRSARQRRQSRAAPRNLQ